MGHTRSGERPKGTGLVCAEGPGLRGSSRQGSVGFLQGPPRRCSRQPPRPPGESHRCLSGEAGGKACRQPGGGPGGSESGGEDTGVPQGPLGAGYAVCYRAPCPPRPPQPCTLPCPHFTGKGTKAERSGDCLRPRGHHSGGSQSEPPGKVRTTPGPGRPPSVTCSSLLVFGEAGGSGRVQLGRTCRVRPEGPDRRLGTPAPGGLRRSPLHTSSPVAVSGPPSLL